ncbi:MAG TPA: hypothetical protein VFX12_10305 [Vicinamibacterales bacterium]|nr:hypothetical protein [Vicinamibacterales bacterium]
MKRSTARLTTALAAAALIGLPAAGWAQTPSGSPAQQTQTPQTQTASPTGEQSTASTPAEHVRKAKDALDSIPKSSIPSADRAKFSQLRTHLNNLERDVAAASANPAGTTGSTAKPEATDTSTEVSKIDSILTDLIGPEGSAPTEAGATASSRSPLDETAQAKLKEIRTEISALALSSGGTGAEASAPSAAAASSAAAAASPATATPASPAGSEPTPASAEPNPTSAMQNPASQNPAEQNPAAQNPTQNPAAQNPSQQNPPSATPQTPDQSAARQHLSDARDALSQLTQMPEASRLSGEARTQVSQLISNFNELITTQSDWHAAYAKVEGNLNTLLGPEGSDESATAPTSPAQSSAPGSVGTTGTTPNTQIDPAIRAKLVQVRSDLKQFEQAAGGAAASSAMNPPASTGAPSSPAAAYPSSSASAAASNPASTEPSAQAGSQGQLSEATRAQVKQHLDAIAAIVDQALGTSASGQPGAKPEEATGTTGTSAKGTLDRAQIEQIKMHLDQLRDLLASNGGGQ